MPLPSALASLAQKIKTQNGDAGISPAPPFFHFIGIGRFGR